MSAIFADGITIDYRIYGITYVFYVYEARSIRPECKNRLKVISDQLILAQKPGTSVPAKEIVALCNVLSTGGRRGEASPPNSQASPPKFGY